MILLHIKHNFLNYFYNFDSKKFEVEKSTKNKNIFKKDIDEFVNNNITIFHFENGWLYKEYIKT